MSALLRRWWAAARRRSTPRVAVQLAAVVVGAVLAGVVAVQYSEASGSWQQAVREETKRSGLRQEQVRAVYGDEAPLAVRAAAAQARADELQRLAGEERANAERVVSMQLAFAARRSGGGGGLVDGGYGLPAGGFDVARRLADVVRAAKETVPEPERTVTEGDARASWAHAFSVLTVVITGAAVVFAALPPRRRRSRRTARITRPGGTEPEIIPQPGAADPWKRRTTSVMLALWAMGVLLPFAQLALGGEEQRSQAAAARIAVELSGQVAIAQARMAFADETKRTAIFTQTAAIARQLAAVDVPGARGEAEAAVAAAEETAAARFTAATAQMVRSPTTDDGIDHHLADALAADEDSWQALGDKQSRQANRAGVFGDWSNRTVVAISGVAAVAAVLQVATASPSAPEQHRRRVRRPRATRSARRATGNPR